MKQHNKVVQLIKLSFTESKPLLIERLLSIVFVCILTFILHFFFDSFGLFIGAIALVGIDIYLIKGRGRFLNARGSSFFNSVIPLNTKEKLLLKLYENIYDYLFIYIVIACVYITVFIDESTSSEQLLYFVLSFFHIWFFTSIPSRFKIIDQDMTRKKKNLNSIIKTIFLSSLFLFIVLIFGIDFYVIEQFFQISGDFFLSENSIYILFIVFIDIILLKQCLSKKWYVADEHSHLQLRKITLNQQLKFLSLVLIVLIGLNIASIPIIKKLADTNFVIVKFAHKVGLVESELLHSINQNNLNNFIDIHKVSLKKQNQNKWYSSEKILRYLIFNNKIEFIGSLLGKDISKWDQKYCKLIEKQQKCGANILLQVGIEKNAQKFLKFLTQSNDYKIYLKSGENALYKVAKNCNVDLIMSLLDRGINPNIPSISKHKDIFTLLLEKDIEKCRKVVSRIMLKNHKLVTSIKGTSK